MWSILIIFGDLRKNREIPNSMSCTDKKKVLFLESISNIIITTESLLEMTISSLFNFSGQ